MSTGPADPTALPAHQLSRLIHARALSCHELMQATLARVHRFNPRFNAIVNLAPEDGLLAQARAMDAELAAGRSRGWMHGLPQAIKDTGQVAGFPTTFGSPLLKDAVAAGDGLMAARMKAAGALVIGKTNMPEWGLGSHTFNELFGATPNAWDPTVSAGGSSGGAAVALALRLLSVADGSDFMGSLRNPAGWNHVFGLRPSQGRVPFWPVTDVWVDQLGTEGPMARCVEDLARLLQTQSGHDPRQPLSIAGPAPAFAPVQPHPLQGLRIGWLGDLGGHLALEPGIDEVCVQALKVFEDGGAAVEPARLDTDLEAVWRAWLVWRRALTGTRLAPLLARPGARERIKPEALWEHDQAAGLGFAQFMAASQARSAFTQCMLAALQRHQLLALPVAQVWPFPIEWRWPQRIGTRAMDTYHRWMEATLYATFAGLPALSLPAGFDPTGRWPMGLQLIGPPQGEALLLQVAAAYEQRVPELLARRPPEPA